MLFHVRPVSLSVTGCFTVVIRHNVRHVIHSSHVRRVSLTQMSEYPWPFLSLFLAAMSTPVLTPDDVYPRPPTPCTSGAVGGVGATLQIKALADYIKEGEAS